MIDICPAILATSEPEFDAKIGRVASLGLPLQLDIMDGIFVNNKSWAPPGSLRGRLHGFVFDAHLMVTDPEHAVPLWLAAGARRVYFHAESTTSDHLIIMSMPESMDRLGVAINPETPVSRITVDLKDIPNVLIMGVRPGWSGQEFQPIALDKIRAIKSMNPAIRIAVDGGVRPENIRQIVEAGADEVIVGKSLTDAPDPLAALAILRQAMQ